MSGSMPGEGSRTISQEQELAELRELVIKLQRDVTRQEGDILDMKRAISSCKTKEQADQQFSLMSTPDHVERKFEAIKRHLMIEIDSKASRSDLNSALSKKATTSDLMKLSQDLDSLIDCVRKHTVNGEALHLMSPIDSVVTPNHLTALNNVDTTQLDLMAEQLTVLESAFDDFVSGAEPKSLKKPTGSGSKGQLSGTVRQIHELTEQIAAFESVCTELDSKYQTLSDWASTYPDKLAECVKLTTSAQQAMTAIEQMIRDSAMDPERVYLEVHPKVQEISKQVTKAQGLMEDEAKKNTMITSCNITQELDRLRSDLLQVKTSLNEQVRSISDTLTRFNKEDATHGKKLAVWQDGVINTLNAVKAMAESNQNGLKNLQQPMLDQFNILKSENKMFFKELLRMEGQYEQLIFELRKAAVRKQSSHATQGINSKS